MRGRAFIDTLHMYAFFVDAGPHACTHARIYIYSIIGARRRYAAYMLQHLHANKNTRSCIPAYICARTVRVPTEHAYSHASMQACTYISAHAPTRLVRACKPARMRAYCLHTGTSTCACTHTHIHAYMHIDDHAHTYIHAPTQSCIDICTFQRTYAFAHTRIPAYMHTPTRRAYTHRYRLTLRTMHTTHA